jgi:phosphoribosyl 1,2-cyclic phosphate phosphodiesterase
MPSISLDFFGTGTSQGVPVIGCSCPVCSSTDRRDRRLRASVRIATETTEVLVDCGPDFRQQMLRAGAAQLDAVVLTHEHMDHVSGLDDLRPLMFAQKRPMPVWMTDRVEARLRQQFSYAFAAERYPGAPEFDVCQIQHPQAFRIGDQTWLPILGIHGTWPVLGYRVGPVVYLTDLSGMIDAERQKIAGAQILVVNALRKHPHVAHFTLGQAVDFARSTGVPQVYFTHISHHLGLHADEDALLPEGMHLAYDGLRLTAEMA